jgi:hypothetical protein
MEAYNVWYSKYTCPEINNICISSVLPKNIVLQKMHLNNTPVSSSILLSVSLVSV